MPTSKLLRAIEELAKSALSEAAKDQLRDWLNDVVRVDRAVRKTALAFSTRLPGAQDALSAWAKTDAFRNAMSELISGRALPESLAGIDEFLRVTGLGFGSFAPDVVTDMLAEFYRAIREELVATRQGLVLMDNRVGEVLRQVQKLRGELAAQTFASPEQLRLQGVAREFMTVLAQKQGWGGDVGFGPEININLDLPPPVQKVSRRPSTVEAIVGILHNNSWYAMHGGSGSGKTQLAILVSQAFVGKKVWIRLGGYQPAAGLILELALAKLAPRRPGESIERWCESACVVAGSEGIIVVDDLPRTQGDEALDEHLVALSAACSQTGVHMVTTSADPLAAATSAGAGSHIHEERVPSFREGEIRELFQAYGAPEQFLASTWFRFVHTIAQWHPVLLVEAARYLQARRWVTDERSFDDLSTGSFASRLDVPTVESIRETVPNEQTREFLYRLKLIGWPFSINEVQRISSVPPPIPFPLEQLGTLVGLWVQQDGDRVYVLSPLVSRLSDANLPRELQQAIHRSLAQAITEMRRLGPLDASKAIAHFIAAGDMNEAAFVLVVALHGMHSIPDVRDPFLLTGIWAGTPLPAEITLERRIYLRCLQVILRDQLHRDRQYELQDLERLLAEAESDENSQWSIAAAGALVAIHLGNKEPELAIRSITRSIMASRRMDRNAVLERESDMLTGLLTLLWMIAAWIRTDEQYEQWFAAIRELTADEVRQWTAIQFADKASEVVCNGIWTRTADLPESERDWARVLGRLEHLQTWAKSASALLLAACSARGKIIVAAEYQSDIPKAESIAQKGMDQVRDLPKAMFWIAETMARQHYYFGDTTDAVRWFDTAFRFGESVDGASLVSSLTLAGIAAHSVGIDLARRYLEEAVAEGRSRSVGALPRATAEGELAILLWNTGAHREAYAVWSGAAQELLAARSDTKEWKNVFRLFGNCTGYFLLTSRGGTLNQDDEMAAPFPGILLRNVSNILELYKPEHDWVLPVQMTLLADSLGAYDDAVTWATRTNVGEGLLAFAVEAHLSGILATRILAEGRYNEIIQESGIADLDEAHDGRFDQIDEGARAQQVRRNVARINLVALTIEVARVGLHDHSRVETIAETISKLARECATNHSGSRFWLGAAAVFDALKTREPSSRELCQRATEARQQGNRALWVMYGVAAIVVADPVGALHIQLNIVPWIESQFFPTLYHSAVAPFVQEFWLWALDQYGLSFGLLKRTREAIDKARALDDKAGVHAILHAVAFSLGIRVPDEMQRWLDSKSS